MAKKKKEAAQDLYLSMVVDKSGSMSSCRDATISAFNEYLDDRRREAGETTVWLTLFNTSFDILNNGVPLKSVLPLSRDNYVPNGNTALYDAIGNTIRATEQKAKENSFKGKILCLIQTDGEENSSKEWTRDKIFALIKEKEAEGNWTFVYLGANADAYAASQMIGVGHSNTAPYSADPAGTRSAVSTMSANTVMYRKAASLNTRNFMQEPDADADLLKSGSKTPK